MEIFTEMRLFTPPSIKALRVWIFCAACLLLGAGSRAGATVVDKTVAAVNDEVILESDIQKFAKKVKSKNFQELFGGGVDTKVLNTPDAILQLLIEEKIINQQVKKLELQASDQEIDGKIHEIMSRNGISEDQLKARLISTLR